MNLKKIIFGFLALSITPTMALAGAEPMHKFKVLPSECKGLEKAKYIQDLDFALDERAHLAKEAAGSINSASQAAPKQEACQRYLRVTKTVEENLDQKLKPARLPVNGKFGLGTTAVLMGVRNLAPECYKAIGKKKVELGEKESNIRQLCKQ